MLKQLCISHRLGIKLSPERGLGEGRLPPIGSTTILLTLFTSSTWPSPHTLYSASGFDTRKSWK